jgi:hypothetical protein
MNHSTISEREATKEANQAEEPTQPAPDASRSALLALEPILGDALRALAEREKKALARAHGKEDEGDRVEKFLADHLRAATLRLEPVAQAVKGLGGSLDAGELAESLVKNASMRATGRNIDQEDAADILSRA